MNSSAVVLGSVFEVNVYLAERFPRPGESIHGTETLRNYAGKGANLACASRSIGCDVVMIQRMGNDLPGRKALEKYQQAGIDTRYVVLDEQMPTGACGGFFAKSRPGDCGYESAYIIVPNANAKLCETDVLAAKDEIRRAALLTAQLEIPVRTVEFAFELAAEYGVRTMLDPAPVIPLPISIYPKVSIIKPNEHEATLLTGIEVEDVDSAFAAGRWFLERGVKEGAIITLGERGCALVTRDAERHYPRVRIEAVSTSGAGDSFGAGLVRGATLGLPLQVMVQYAQAVAGLRVSGLQYEDFTEEKVMQVYRENYGPLPGTS